jgi:hypothetical protein
MGFFSSLFGGGGTNRQAYAKNDNAETWPAKFMLMAITEASEEAPDRIQAVEVIQSAFPEFPNSEFDKTFSAVCDMHECSSGSSEEWDKIWDNFSSQMSSMALSDTFSIVRQMAAAAFILKMEPEMEVVAETYVYRMSTSEKYLNIGKSDYLQILEEEKENTGYNQFLNGMN